MANWPVDVFFSDPMMTDLVVFTQDGIDRSIDVHWFNPYEQIVFGEIAFQNSMPSVLAKTSDVPGVDHTGTVTHSGVVYSIHEVKPDEYGFTMIMLTRKVY